MKKPEFTPGSVVVLKWKRPQSVLLVISWGDSAELSGTTHDGTWRVDLAFPPPHVTVFNCKNHRVYSPVVLEEAVTEGEADWIV